MIIWKYQKIQTFFRRSVFLAIAFVFLFLILISRLIFLQIIEGDKYKLMAEKNRISVRLTLPPRGNIYDRNGVLLAGNQKTFQALLVKEQTKDFKKTLDLFSLLIPLDEEERARIEKEISRRRAFMPVRVKENLTFDEIAKIQLNAPDLPGIMIEEGFTRFYPQGESATHAVGYVSLVQEKDVEPDSPLLDLPGYRIGRLGIEQSYNDILKGTPGIRKTEVNAFGRSVRILENEAPVAGEDVHLTISTDLQKFITETLKNESASAIVLDVNTGDVLGYVSSPSFDPNLFNRPIPKKEWSALIGNKKKPLRNKPIADIYSPGSIFKLVVGLAGLEGHDITPSQKVFCSGKTKVGNQQFHCWKKDGHGHLDIADALKHSCDVYFYEMSQRIGVDKISAMAKKLGFGAPTGIDLSGEEKGLVPSRLWKEQTRKDGWRIGDTLNLSIGQGFLTATPMQLAVLVAEIANGGYQITPHLVKRENIDDNLPLNLNKNSLKNITRGMNAVVNEEGGTAYGSRFVFQGDKMAGKTASTQVRRISLKEREEGIKSQDELPWELRDHGMFVAFTPVDNPRYAVAVVVEHGGGGSRAAAPLASKILKETLRLEAQNKISSGIGGGVQ